MPESPNPGQSYEAWIESKAGASPACPRCGMTHGALIACPMPMPDGWPFPPEPPYPADDEGLEEPRDA